MGQPTINHQKRTKLWAIIHYRSIKERHAVRLKQKSKTKRKKKITAAIYEYQADCDGEWGEMSVDFENGTAEIIRLADWDTIKTNWFANEAIRYILSLSPDALKKYMLVPLEPPLIS